MNNNISDDKTNVVRYVSFSATFERNFIQNLPRMCEKKSHLIANTLSGGWIGGLANDAEVVLVVYEEMKEGETTTKSSKWKEIFRTESEEVIDASHVEFLITTSLLDDDSFFRVEIHHLEAPIAFIECFGIWKNNHTRSNSHVLHLYDGGKRKNSRKDSDRNSLSGHFVGDHNEETVVMVNLLSSLDGTIVGELSLTSKKIPISHYSDLPFPISFSQNYSVPSAYHQHLYFSENLFESQYSYLVPMILLESLIENESQTIDKLNRMMLENENVDYNRKLSIASAASFSCCCGKPSVCNFPQNIKVLIFQQKEFHSIMRQMLKDELKKINRMVMGGSGTKPFMRTSVQKRHQDLQSLTLNCCVQELFILEDPLYDVGKNKMFNSESYFVVTFGAPTIHNETKKILNIQESNLSEQDEESIAKIMQNYANYSVKSLTRKLEEYGATLNNYLNNQLRVHIENFVDTPIHVYANPSPLRNLVKEVVFTVNECLKYTYEVTSNAPPKKNECQYFFDSLEDEIRRLTERMKSICLPELYSDVEKLLNSREAKYKLVIYDMKIGKSNYVAEEDISNLVRTVNSVHHTFMQIIENCFALIENYSLVADYLITDQKSWSSDGDNYEKKITNYVERKLLKLSLLSQVLGAAVTGFVSFIFRFFNSNSISDNDAVFWEGLTTVGILLQFESLLSSQGDEKVMLTDFYNAIIDLKQSVFFKVHFHDEDVGKDSCPPVVITGPREELVVSIGVPQWIFERIPNNLASKKIKLCPVLFSVGINEKQLWANLTFSRDTQIQSRVNEKSFNILNNFFEEWKGFLLKYGDVGDYSYPVDLVQKLQEILYEMKQIIFEKKTCECMQGSISTFFSRSSKLNSNSKNKLGIDFIPEQDNSQSDKKKKNGATTLLLLAEHCTRIFATLMPTKKGQQIAPIGIRFTSCKSAKDRTSMAATLEQVLILRYRGNSKWNSSSDSLYDGTERRSFVSSQDLLYDRNTSEIRSGHFPTDSLSLHHGHFLKLLNAMRGEEGARMFNVQRNIGRKKYAFNSIQWTILPILYRPPLKYIGENRT